LKSAMAKDDAEIAGSQDGGFQAKAMAGANSQTAASVMAARQGQSSGLSNTLTAGGGTLSAAALQQDMASIQAPAPAGLAQAQISAYQANGAKGSANSSTASLTSLTQSGLANLTHINLLG
jgi:hypothetical protein